MKAFLKSALGIIAIVAAVVSLLTAVRLLTRQPSVILSDTICQPPCWGGIQPGVTTSAEVDAILSAMEGVDGGSIQENTTLGGDLRSTSWFFTRPAEDAAGTILYRNDRVALISILTVNTLKLDDIISRLGMPTRSWSAISQGENRAYVTVGLLAPERGFQVELVISLEDQTDQVSIRPRTSVFKVKYFDPADFPALLAQGDLVPNTADQDPGALPAWKGYGVLEIAR